MESRTDGKTPRVRDTRKGDEIVRHSKETWRARIKSLAITDADFGTLKVVPSRFNRDKTLGVLDFDYWKVCYLRPFQTTKLAVTGDNDSWMITAEYCLESSNEAASGKVADLATS